MSTTDREMSQLAVCLVCGQLRGGHPREHRCRCQPRTAQWTLQWAGRDMARDLELCVLCVRDTVTTASRWSWLACNTCRTVSRAMGEANGVRSILPLGRHSLMNGIGVRLADGDLQVRRQTNAFLATVQRWDSLNAWQRTEFAWLAAPLCGAGPTVSLVEWQRRWPPSLGASVDAFERYAGSPVPDELTDLRQARDDFRTSAP